MTQRAFYRFMASATVAGCLWILFSLFTAKGGAAVNTTVCPIKLTTGWPCTSCGGTRSLMHILNGDWLEALVTNLVGYIYFLLLVLMPAWLIWDIYSGKSSMHTAWIRTELFIRKPPVWMIGILLLLANWIWNISKDV